jgi:hypothetical protein
MYVNTFICGHLILNKPFNSLEIHIEWKYSNFQLFLANVPYSLSVGFSLA